MSGWAAKRFWQSASAEQVPGGWAVGLDGRRLRTPAKEELIVPASALAEAIAAEWEAQGELIEPATMPLTRIANSAIDKVLPQKAAVADMLAAYGGSDLLCYRAPGPEGLTRRQQEAWDPLLDWARDVHGAPLVTAAGVMHVRQPERSLARLREQVHALTHFQLAPFHDLVTLSGSLILALAVLQGRLAAAEAWQMSRLDELWQQEFWGVDEEAESAAAAKQRDFEAAARFLTLLD